MPKGLSYPSGPAGAFQDASSFGSLRQTGSLPRRTVPLADVVDVQSGEGGPGLGTITIIVLVSLAIFIATVNLGTKD